MMAELRMQNVEWRNHLPVAMVSLVVILFCGVASASAESVHLFGLSVPSVCGFKLITGLDCPGCGLTRALILAFHGRFYESYLMHMWGIPLAAMVLLQVPYRLLLAVSKQAQPWRLPATFRHWLVRFVFLSFLLPWVAKTIALLAIWTM